jgi:hypothetical protein
LSSLSLLISFPLYSYIQHNLGWVPSSLGSEPAP